MPNGLVHFYHLDKSISNFRGAWCTFSFLFPIEIPVSIQCRSDLGLNCLLKSIYRTPNTNELPHDKTKEVACAPSEDRSACEGEFEGERNISLSMSLRNNKEFIDMRKLFV